MAQKLIPHARVALLHHIGGGNLGDDATLDVVAENITARWPDIGCVAISLNPEDTATRHALPAYPARRSTWTFGYGGEQPQSERKVRFKAMLANFGPVLAAARMAKRIARMPADVIQEVLFAIRSYRLLQTCMMLVVCGGGQLTEWGGPWGFPFTIFKWVGLAKLAGIECIVLNVGAGPLNGRLSRRFVSTALRFADRVSFRDSDSKLLVAHAGFTQPSTVHPDCVYNLNLMRYTQRRRAVTSRIVVAISPMPYLDPRTFPAQKDEHRYAEFVGKLARFSARLLDRRCEVTVFGTDIGVDPLAIADFRCALLAERPNAAPEVPLEPQLSSLDAVMAKMSDADVIVTCRFHGVVFAHLLNKPVLALAHHPKVTKLMTDIGLSKYCLDIDTFDEASLERAFDSLIANRSAIKTRLTQSAHQYRCDLDAQFDQLFPRAADDSVAV